MAHTAPPTCHSSRSRLPRFALRSSCRYRLRRSSTSPRLISGKIVLRGRIPTPEPTPFRNARRMFLTILGDLERGLPRREGDPVPPRVPSSHLEIVRRGSSSHFAASFFFRPSPTTFAWNATAL